VSLLSTANWSDYTEYYVCLDVVTKTTFDQVAKLESQLKAKEQELEEANEHKEVYFKNCQKLQEAKEEAHNVIEVLSYQLEEARDLLLQVQDSMSNLSTHSHEGWAIACADDTFNMIEQYVDVIELKEKGE